MAYLMHEGTPHEGMTPHSGRYPWGSGENPNQHPRTFIEHVKKMESEGLSEKEIASGMGMSIRELRSRKSLAKTDIRKENREEALRLSAAGYGASEIGRRLDLNESTVRNLLREDIAERQTVTKTTADILAKEVSKQKYIDIGLGTAESMGISSTRLDAAVQYLKNQGYTVHKFNIPQAGSTDQATKMKVLCGPDVTWKEAREHAEDIGIINARFKDPNGRTLLGLEPVKSISSKKIEVAYREDGGAKKDGVIELRRGAEELSLGDSRYAQVRIGVDGTHFLKGMAIYSDDLPDGVDIRFNTNKSKSDPSISSKLDVFKAMKTTADGTIDQDNPFGTAIKAGGQRGYLNIVREEGDWSTWSKTLASQMLSKQPITLAKKQLYLTQEIARQQLDEIKSLTNPVVKKHMLEQFADSCDTAAVHLKAAAMPRQASHVILPLDSISPNQIYAPQYKNGETVVLIRYPHGGTFEIPQLTVNNRNKEAQRLFGGAMDAVGIHHSVAERLSGADFDGDTVVVIPNNAKRILTKSPLKGLEGFDPKTAYPYRKGMKVMTDDQTQMQMGIVSNLITDMTLQRASDDHMARAVRHSMVVIDAAKHKLDYKQSEKDNGIVELQKIYQVKTEPTASGKTYGGASTLISRAKSQVWVPHHEEIKGNKGIDPITGEKLYRETGKVKFNKSTGLMEPRSSKTSQMALAKDARSLISTRGTAMESLYADHANTMKALGNQARKAILATPDPVRNKEAALKYKAEVEALTTRLNEAVQHQPYERKAQVLANHIVQMKRRDNPTMTREERIKIHTQALGEMRARLGGKKPVVTISYREWEAIQAGAVSKTTLKRVLNYADQEAVKQLALPKSAKGMTSAKVSLAKALHANGYTLDEIATRLGVSSSTVSKVLKS